MKHYLTAEQLGIEDASKDILSILMLTGKYYLGNFKGSKMDPLILYYTGVVYEKGWRVQQDWATAAQSYKHAMILGHSNARIAYLRFFPKATQCDCPSGTKSPDTSMSDSEYTSPLFDMLGLSYGF